MLGIFQILVLSLTSHGALWLLLWQPSAYRCSPRHLTLALLPLQYLHLGFCSARAPGSAGDRTAAAPPDRGGQELAGETSLFRALAAQAEAPSVAFLGGFPQDRALNCPWR